MHFFESFKGFKNTGINLLRPLTLLIGPNGSGKSNAIEAVELLSFIARGRYLHEVVEAGRGGDTLELRGGLKACARFGENAFTLGFRAQTKFAGNARPIEYRVCVRTDDVNRIRSESLIFIDTNEMIFQTQQAGPARTSADNWVSYNNFDKGPNKPQVPVSANRSVLSQYKDFATKNKKHAECEKLVTTISRHLRSSYFFDPRPSMMRKYEKIGDDILQRNGSNLSSVLYGLSADSQIAGLISDANERERQLRKAATLDRLRKWICTLPEEEFVDFEFVPTRISDVIFGLRTAAGGSLVDASLLSDGTLRSLAFLTAVETADEGSRIVMEEFDNGVHPSRVKTLVEAVSECAKRRRLNLLVTTHNPATLNSLSDEQMKGVVFSVWSPIDKCYRFIELSDIPRLPELLESGRLGDLVTKKIVERYLEPGLDEQRRASISNWLKDLS
ncbi:MAG: ATP-binding protein [Opitutaceae bacterium]|nr:ATP-binding protein [Opitutaceae bacterium]